MLWLMKGLRAGGVIEFDQLIGRDTDIGLFHTETQVMTRQIVTVPDTVLSRKPVRVTRRAGTVVNAESIEQLSAEQEKLIHKLEGTSTEASAGENRAAVRERLAAIEAEIPKREEAKETQRLDENSLD